MLGKSAFYWGSILLLWIVLQTLPANSKKDPDFSYVNASQWSKKFPKCAGKQQSPISLNKKTAETKKLAPLKLKNYKREQDGPRHKYTLANTVFGVKLTLRNSIQPSITADFLDGKYIFEAVFIHWGPKDDSGSEHEIDGKRFAAELQFVHYSEKYSDYDEAEKHENGLVILSHVFEATKGKGLDALESLTTAIRGVTKIGSKRNTSPQSLISFDKLEPGMDNFYMYNGSIPAPPCYKSAIWLVDPKPKKIGKRPLDALRGTKLPGDAKTDARPIQPLNGRTVIYASTSN